MNFVMKNVLTPFPTMHRFIHKSKLIWNVVITARETVIKLFYRTF